MIAPLRPDDPPAVGPYCLTGRLGGGGMGQVFLGRSAGGLPVAVKIIRAELASDPEFRTRFRDEVAVARKVSGTFTAQVVDADPDGSVQWLATAYVAGPSLAEAISSGGPLPVDKVLSLAAGLAEGLTAIHAAGVVHRDLKPGNVLLTEDGPRVIDFGICWAAWASASPGRSFGSPRFMSPEHALGQVIGPPSDIFSLGAVLAFAATGQGPFGSGSSAALLYRLVNSPARLDSVPAELRELVGGCLAKHPDDRPTASRLLEQVSALQHESGRAPDPASGPPAGGQPAARSTDSEDGAEHTMPAAVSAGAELAAVEPQPDSGGRDLRHRFRRSLPLFVPGLVAALAAAVFLVSRAADSSSVTLAQPQTGTTSAVQAQPQAGGAATMPGPLPAAAVTPHAPASARQRQIAAAIIQGPRASAVLNPAAFTSTLPAPFGSADATGGNPSSSSPSSSARGSASPKSSKSASPSPKSSKSASPSPKPTGSSSGSGSPSAPPSSSSSSPAPASSSASTPASPSPTGT